ncbi:MAG TPA: glycosyltransferase [Pseudonocardiaceae bacterium]|jgi:glycosyltransferase involved in cell wall biosynthesis|nr:glycosyltransferase [Pseudonocardiaceae bacterium]
MGGRILYLDNFTAAVAADPSNRARGLPSSAIGYGITASRAIQCGLADRGWQVTRPRMPTAGPHPDRMAQMRWVVDTYAAVLDELTSHPPDLIFCFHSFAAFPVEIRRMLLDLDLSVPVVGYTHGSHWDDTDSYRFERYPGMELADLANLHVLDRVLLVSDYMHATLRRSIGRLSDGLADEVLSKSRVVGLPLDVTTIDQYRCATPCERTTVVFNHAPVSSKDPGRFAGVMTRIMKRHDVDVLVTRSFTPSSPGGPEMLELAAHFPDRVRLAGDLPLADYYRGLWQSQLQVSTARHESLGIATLEAMYTRTCCVLPKIGSYPEICSYHPEVLYEPASPGSDDVELEERITHFLDNPETRERVACDLARFATRYRPAVVVAAIDRVLRELCAPPG